jgi:bifunctional DNA-binding transcriptional regulator/antitoxin component of YhaV-PrlF toxin-antitoxin module
MPKVKVQQRKVTARGEEYEQLWIDLPKTICEALTIEAGQELELFIEDGDIILRRATLPGGPWE